MKAKLFAILVCAFLLPAFALAATPTFYAGQTTDVGYLDVSNDDDNFYVDFVVENGWELLGTHLYVGKTDPNTLTTAPGQFPYKSDNPYTIALADIDNYEMEENKKGKETGKMIPSGTPGVDVGDQIWIAAHAELRRFVETLNHNYDIFSDESILVTQGNEGIQYPKAAELAWEPGLNYPNDGADDSSWESDSLWDQNVDYTFSSADWIWETYRVVSPEGDETVTFERTFDVAGEPISGDLHITCDNEYVVSLNGNELGSDDHWQSVENYDLTSSLVSGTNTLTLVAVNAPLPSGEPTQSSNPAGCIFEATVDSEEDIYQYESAWAEGDDFTHPNWAMYFEYDVAEEYNACTFAGVDAIFWDEGNIIYQDRDGDLETAELTFTPINEGVPEDVCTGTGWFAWDAQAYAGEDPEGCVLDNLPDTSEDAAADYYVCIW